MAYKIQVPRLQFENKIILQESSLIIEDGKSYCITGANGSGKTTLLNYMMTGTETKIYKKRKEIDLLEFKRNTAFIPNNPPIFDLLTGWENIQYICSLWRIKDKDNYLQEVKMYCDLFELSQESLHDQVHTYSLGMKYKLFLISMISRNINLLLLDEPFTALDKNSQQEIYKILVEFLERGNSLIFVTHIEEFKNQLGDYIYEIRDKTLSKLQ
ncbi:ABC transporter ATP-binding protein [Bacillus thuringiensis]|uniref:ATP-binding cassette domain-containing protein n=1 Tax=Bacillus TaxID=1386 RepID=UPI0018CD127F|nr:ATP-binding cassette domain-containing protein [Bacillus thuringiensis]HEF1856325.1 ATP-binding cassette domain-containing protein [Bacillus cereus]MBG9503165.1 ABC transporter ATP-binding protein [Bacillus thuringiensis]MBG9510899.1 ABC transporter ATP-binding protein [Bacillus thuringiensis]HEF1865954.1 ATP-binding cassette domain-containing protein [Bacillus cereus]HEF1879229.1 ATP-binding cassette domain-containing protein [Bacillus cereus]